MNHVATKQAVQSALASFASQPLAAAATECADWIRQKVDIKTVRQTGFLHGKLYQVATFRKRLASSLQTGRDFRIPDQKDQANDTIDFELVTWLVIKAAANQRQ